MDDREKLLALIAEARHRHANDYTDHTENEYIADMLLDKGVYFAVDNNDGSKKTSKQKAKDILDWVQSTAEVDWGFMCCLKQELEQLVAIASRDDAFGGKWIPVTERLPENEVAVIILAERRMYGIPELDQKTVRIVATAFHTDGKMNTEESSYTWDLYGTNAEYDEEADAYIVPEGWWESVLYGEEFSAVDDFVTHWMPMPLPLKGE